MVACWEILVQLVAGCPAGWGGGGEANRKGFYVKFGIKTNNIA